MALLPSIMSLFGSKPQAGPVADPATQQQQQAAAGANPTVPSQTTPVSTGSVAAIPAVPAGDGSPLANFADLWKADPNQKQQTTSLIPAFNLDPAGLMKVAQGVNFTQHIDPGLVDKAMAGDKESFLQVINQAAQLGFANATGAAGELVKNSLTTANGVLTDTVLPQAMRNQQISQALSESNPIFSDPAVAPMLGMLKSQLAMKYPTAPASEIAAHATKYLAGMSEKIVTAAGGTVTPKSQQGVDRNTGFRQNQDPDWEQFFAQG